MQFYIDDENFIEVEASDNEETIAQKLIDHPAMEEIAKRVGKDSYFEAFPSDLLSGDGANEIAEAYLDGGYDAVVTHFITQNWDRNPSEYYYEMTKGDFKKELDRVISELFDENFDLDDDEIRDTVSDYFQSTIEEAMCDADDSKVENAIPSHARADIIFVPDLNKLGLDDVHTYHWDVCSSAETIIPDRNAIRALKFFNVSPEEFIEECKKRGFDPCNPDIADNTPDYRRKDIELHALTWRSILEVRGIGSGHVRQLPLRSTYEMAMWNETVELARSCKDYDRPASLSMDTLFTVLNEAIYGGVPSYICRIPVSDIVEGVLDKPFLATGGFIGIHSYGNGSGFIEKPDAPVLIDPTKGAFRVRSVDNTYGIVPSYYNPVIEHVEVSPWLRVKENMWRKTEDDGRHAEISLVNTKDGDEFWVLTQNEEGDLDGPRATSEVFGDLESAKQDAEAALAEAWEAASPSL